MSRLRTTLLAATVLSAAIALTGCSTSQPMGGMGGMNDGSSTPSASAGSFTAEDVSFVQAMLPHHEQAVQMSDILLARSAVDPRVADLARTIRSAQAPEIVTMNSWLAAWGESKGSMSSMNHGDSGMMSDSDLSRLKSSSGTEAARLYLTAMVAHHQGAVAMAQTEISKGTDVAAISLAKSIVSSQNAEITTMKDLLATLA